MGTMHAIDLLMAKGLGQGNVRSTVFYTRVVAVDIELRQSCWARARTLFYTCGLTTV